MGTKANPSQFDCYANAEPDEPMFILLARDPAAPALVESWADRRERDGKTSPEKIAEARACAQAMRRWKKAKDDLINSAAVSIARDFGILVEEARETIELAGGDPAKARAIANHAKSTCSSPVVLAALIRNLSQ